MARTKSKKSSAPAPAESIVTELDMPMMRAQVVNCVTAACLELEAANEEVEVEASFFRIEDLETLFGLTTNFDQPRIYRLTVVDPDGSKVALSRFDDEGNELALDEFDGHFVEALSMSLTTTVCAAFKHIASWPKETTHSGVSTLQ